MKIAWYLLLSSWRKKLENPKKAPEKLAQSKILDSLESEEIKRIIHELEVHQIELEMQNEELLGSNAELEVARDRYSHLYDMAPVGYCTINEKNLILEANLTVGLLLDVPREALVSQPITHWIFKEDQDTYYLIKRNIFEQKKPNIVELRMVKKDGTVFWADMTIDIAQGYNDTFSHRIILRDITRHKLAEEEKNSLHILLHILSEGSDLDGLLQALLSFFKNWTGIDGIGIRLKLEDDFPYFKTLGFPREFVLCENSLRSIDGNQQKKNGKKSQTLLECMCGHVISGMTNPSSPLFTTAGSFWTNSTTLLLSQSSDMKMPYGMRFHCNKAGYESLLLVPLRVGGNTLGLLQFNDKTQNRYSKEFVALMERFADHISVAVAQRLAEENLKAKQIELEETNAALKVLIRNREADLLEHDRGLLVNIRQLVLPCIERLKLGTLNRQQITQLKIMESNLETITSPFAQRLASPDIALTPALIQVADLIKKGISNKEIALLLGISVKSVETYRKRIRRRLNLDNSKLNLRAYLLNI